MTESAEETHYVLVIHGTWNAPREGRRHWYQLDPETPGNFCHALNERLESLGIGRAVWRACQGTPTEFAWSPADNTHEARLLAGQRLAQHIVEITEKDPTARIHLVAHSHGGNVVLKAVELYLNSFLRHQAKYTWAEEPAQVLEEDLWATFEALGVKRPEADRRDASSSRPSDDEWRRPNKAALWEFASETRETAKPGLDRFTSWWTQSATHNRLGRIVFLGTPFYLKAWGGRWFWSRVRAFLLEALFWVALCAAAGFLAIETFWLAVATALYVVGLPIGFPSLNPANWPVWLLVLWGAFGIWGLYRARTLTSPIDSNLYYEETLTAHLLLKQPVAFGSKRALPLEALVVTGRFLDEVFLLMASEPIIHAALTSGMHRLSFRKRDWRVRSAPGIFAPMVEGAVLSVRRLVAKLLYPITWPFKKLLVRYLTRTLFRFLKASGFGVDPAELQDGRVMLSYRPWLRYVMREHVWEVAAPLARQSASAAPVETRERYSFLWNEARLEEQMKQSPLWAKVNSLLEERARQGWNAALKDKYSAATLGCMTLALEERISELLGLVDLAHSHYYSNQDVVERVAQFIARGELPPNDR